MPTSVCEALSEITLAGILGEAGDLSGFAHGNSALRHAGSHLAEASSGKCKGQIVLFDPLRHGRKEIIKYELTPFAFDKWVRHITQAAPSKRRTTVRQNRIS